MPFDEFIEWQLAGDLLPDATDEQVMATTFNRLHRQTSEGGSEEEEFRVEYVVDRVDTFGAAFLGLTVGCARCHDHKYDPLTQKEYYQLSAYFNNIDEAGLYPFFTSSVPTPTLDLANESQKGELSRLRQAVAEEELALASLKDARRAAFRNWLESQPKDTALRGLIGKFTFDEITADKANEVRNLADPAKPGTLDEQPKIVAREKGQALLLDGEDNFNTEVGGTFHRYDPFTIGLWIKTPDVKERAVVWHRSRASIDAGSRGYELLIEDGKLSATVAHFLPGNAASVRSKRALPVDQWVHVAVTYDGSSSAAGLRIYSDGQLLETDVVRDSLTRRIVYAGESNIVDEDKVAGIAHRLAIGQRFRDRGLIGGMADELLVFDRELSEFEIATLLKADDIYRQLVEKGKSLSDIESEQLYDYYLRNHDEAYTEQSQKLRQARRVYADAYDAIPEIMVMREMKERRPAYFLDRGAYDARGEEVGRQTPAWLALTDGQGPDDRLGPRPLAYRP